MTTEVLVRDRCSECGGAGCDACKQTGKQEEWVPLTRLGDMLNADAYEQQRGLEAT